MFSNVSAKRRNGKIIVTLGQGAQIINRVAFEGNSKIKSEQLDGRSPIQGRARHINEAIAKADIDRIKEAYKKFGRNEAKVTYRLVQLPNGRVGSRLHHRRRRQNRHPRDQIRRQPARSRTIACTA